MGLSSISLQDKLGSEAGLWIAAGYLKHPWFEGVEASVFPPGLFRSSCGLRIRRL